MTIQEATRYSIEQLKTIYGEGEAIAISQLVFESLTHTRKAGRSLQKEKKITHEEQTKLESLLKRLLTHEPVQYVLNESWFCGLKFYVDRNVLVPRPETEELVEWIITNCKFPIDQLKILDIGSGSGCIPIALKRKLRKAEVWSCDISEEALNVATHNSTMLGTDVHFFQLDFLDKHEWERLPSFDIIVSNPPYIPEKDKEQMPSNVLNYEPATALFVPDNEPLIFYKAIAEFGKEHLVETGSIYVETHENIGEATAQLFKANGYIAELKKDMQGKDRMLKVNCAL